MLAGAIVDDSGSRLLLAQRRSPPELAGLWELPGGKAEPGEGDAEALRRELAEELGIESAVGSALAQDVSLGDEVVLIARWVHVVDGAPEAREHRAVRWVDAGELTSMAERGELVPADTAWLPELVARLRAARGV